MDFLVERLRGLGIGERSHELISDSGHETDALGHAGEEGRKPGHERVREAAKRAMIRTYPNGATP